MIKELIQEHDKQQVIRDSIKDVEDSFDKCMRLVDSHLTTPQDREYYIEILKHTFHYLDVMSK